MKWFKEVPWEMIIKLTHLFLDKFWPGHCCKCLGCHEEHHAC